MKWMMRTKAVSPENKTVLREKWMDKSDRKLMKNKSRKVSLVQIEEG